MGLTALCTALLASCASEPLPSPQWQESPLEVLAQHAGKGQIRAGAGRVGLDPPFPSPLAGYFGASCFALREARDPLYVRAVVIEQGDYRLALVVADRVFIPPALREAVERDPAFERSRVQAWILSVTHTHSAPGGHVDAWPAEAFGTGTYDPLLFQDLATRVARAIEAAASSLRPVQLEAGSATLGAGFLRDVAFNRRDPDDAADAGLDVLRLIAVAGEWARHGQVTAVKSDPIVARWVRFAAHPTLLPFYLRRSSGDYPGALCRELDEDGLTLFASGASGDIAAGAPEDTPVVGWEARVERIARRLAGAVHRIEESLALEDRELVVAHVAARVRLPPREPWRVPFAGRSIASYYPETALLQCLRLGQVLVVTFPGEMGHELGERIRKGIQQATAARHVLLWTLTDQYLGYAFTKESIERGGKSQHLSAYGSELGPLLENRMQDLAVKCWTAAEAGGRVSTTAKASTESS